MIGLTFGRLTVVGEAPKISGQRAWMCLCVCGTLRDVRQKSLKNGETKSCGCLRKQATSARRKKHGLTGTRVWRSWHSARQRCYNRSSQDYPAYGARGIKMCKRWNEFAHFLSDMGPCPEGRTLDRINNLGDYEPENCRWATPKEQAQNTRRNRRLSLNGTTLLIGEWARLRGWNHRVIAKRLARGWLVERALTEPLSTRGFYGSPKATKSKLRQATK